MDDAMMNKLKARLRSRAGESIAETLLALLIASLAMMMLAGAISAAGGIVTRSRTAMEEYYGEDAKLAAHSGTPNGGTVTIAIEGGGSASYAVNFYTNARADQVTAYGARD